jgi:hypothetical protein
MSSKSKSAPFSTHSRGVPLFDGTRLLDFPRHAARLVMDLRDLSSSGLWFCAQQTWLTLWSVCISICSVSFFVYYGNNFELASNVDFTLVGFVVVLPLVGFIWLAFWRRERCLDDLSAVKGLMLHIHAAHRDWTDPARLPPGHLSAVQEALLAVTSAMHNYFLPPRFYSRTYPYFGYRNAMIQIALDRAKLQRQMRGGLASLSGAAVALRSAGLPPALEASLHDRVLALHTAIDRLSNVKEFRTPQARHYLLLIDD